MTLRLLAVAVLLSGMVFSGKTLREIVAQSPTLPVQKPSKTSPAPKATTFKFRSKTSQAEVARLRAEYAKHGPPSPAEVAKRNAIQSQQVKEALSLAKVDRYPIFHAGGSGMQTNVAAVARVENRGTKIVPDANAEGELLAVQKDFAAAMTKGDPQPPNRTDHFRWLNNSEAFKQDNGRVIGWYGAVVDTKRTPEGSWLIQIVIRPWIQHTSRGILIDKVLETYEFSNGQIKLIESDAHLVHDQSQQVYLITY
ncbi:hypothetical protein [Singulisphaera acidiphila]|uniref:Uncharacterized protein n=1 Tax=Singulisphaera acidiphila (strain ATCC BAA-1392 / DSM 18658 / VKM B-2454 / MOB10) TaxID=886293 RepID=L0DLY5_SINAD|nr:hypothetical protein [Singulisphaera acidiphila]AGA30267.1 hypothetical protein Sinac_6167 [Singulisphaera acidiphila DSM 18658]